MWRAIRKQKSYLFLAFVFFGIMVVIGEAFIPTYVKSAIDLLHAEKFSQVLSIVWILGGLYFLQRIAMFISMKSLIRLEAPVAAELDRLSYSYFTRHSFGFYTNEYTGSLVEKVTRLGDNSINVIDMMLFEFFGMIISMASIFIVLFLESSLLGIIFLVFLLLYLVLIFWMGRRLAPTYAKRSVAKTAYKGFISDIITNIQTVIFFGTVKYEKEKFQKSNNDYYKKLFHSWDRAINHQDSISLIPSFFVVVISALSIHWVTIGSMSIGSVVLVFLLANSFTSQVWRLGNTVKRFVSTISDCIEAIDIIETDLEVVDVTSPEKFQPKGGALDIDTVNFKYPDGEDVFSGLSLSIPREQSIGIVGRSGSGKSTITKLLLRLYDVDSGTINFDGQDISRLKQEDVRSHIAYVPQETTLLHRTVYENILIANPSATRDQVLQAAKLAHVDEFVQKLPDSYETLVGERGLKLSGGQRQRIGVARAMLRTEASVLIMDEATSSLDTISEQYIQESFRELSRNRTTIVIAHRLSTIKNMERIIVMDEAEIVEDGTHESLLQKQGHYQKLWNLQNAGFTRV